MDFSAMAAQVRHTRMLSPRRLAFAALLLAVRLLGADPKPAPDWAAVDVETMRHFQALLRFDTSDPPGGELPAVEYLQKVFAAEGIPTKIFSVDPKRPNLVARLKGNGSKRPLLI